MRGIQSENIRSFSTGELIKVNERLLTCSPDDEQQERVGTAMQVSTDYGNCCRATVMVHLKDVGKGLSGGWA